MRLRGPQQRETRKVRVRGGSGESHAKVKGLARSFALLFGGGSTRRAAGQHGSTRQVNQAQPVGTLPGEQVEIFQGGVLAGSQPWLTTTRLLQVLSTKTGE